MRVRPAAASGPRRGVVHFPRTAGAMALLRSWIMRVTLAQPRQVVGDLAGNAESIREAVEKAAGEGSDLVVLPELSILGYPPRDLLLREEVVPACEAAVAEIARSLPVPTLVGSPRRVQGGRRPIANSMALCRGGRVEAWHDKLLLPTYDVFDEARWFEPGREPLVFDLEVDGTRRRVGVLVCEDLWQGEDVRVDTEYVADPVAMLAAAGCDLVVSPSASPFIVGKFQRHESILAAAASRLGAPIAMVNQCGAHDDLVFDGGSLIVSEDGTTLATGPRFQTGGTTFDLDRKPASSATPLGAAEERYHAITLAIRAYLDATGIRSVLLGLSGGIDSAVVVALAVGALGPDRVRGVLLPSRYSSEHARADALESAAALGIRTDEIPIENLHRCATESLDRTLELGGGGLLGIADENVQARLRGLLLMAISNAEGPMLLSTSNKSELAVGYSTLYGDMCGGLAPIGDLYKTEVFALARWMNEHHAALGFERPMVPVGSIEKPPSAELRPDQRDEDSLPPYDQLDRYLRSRIDDRRSPGNAGRDADMDAEVVARVERLLAFSEFKRYQATIVPKLSARTFGRGREIPIVARWRTLD